MSDINHLPIAEPATPVRDNRKVKRSMPRRQSNRAVRSREHLTPGEVDALAKAARSGRYGARDAALIETMFRHGLRVSELVAMRWESVDLKVGLLHVTRVKNGTPSTHPLRGPELRALREVRRAYPDSPYVFCSERGGPMTTDNVRKMVARAGRVAIIPFPVHPHMLRHALGYKLAADGQDTRAIQLYLGHVSITHTAHYTALSPDRFATFFKD